MEARQWLEQAIAQAEGTKSAALADCHSYLAMAMLALGELDQARRSAHTAVVMSRDLDDTGGTLAEALLQLGMANLQLGELGAARPYIEESLQIRRRTGEYPHRMVDMVAYFEGTEGNHGRSLELIEEAIELAHAAGNVTAIRQYQHNRACTLRAMGRAEEARAAMVTNSSRRYCGRRARTSSSSWRRTTAPCWPSSATTRKPSSSWALPMPSATAPSTSENQRRPRTFAVPST